MHNDLEYLKIFVRGRRCPEAPVEIIVDGVGEYSESHWLPRETILLRVNQLVTNRANLVEEVS